MKLTKYFEKKEELYGKMVTVSYNVGRTVKSISGKWAGDPNGKYVRIRDDRIYYKEITDIALGKITPSNEKKISPNSINYNR